MSGDTILLGIAAVCFFLAAFRSYITTPAVAWEWLGVMFVVITWITA